MVADRQQKIVDRLVAYEIHPYVASGGPDYLANTLCIDALIILKGSIGII